MSNFSKIVIIIILVLSFLFIKVKYSDNIINFISTIRGIKQVELPEIPTASDGELVKVPTEILNNEEQKSEKETAEIYFLALDSNSNGIYKKVQRDVPNGNKRLEYAIKELLNGPNIVEKSMGAYSEIPKTTKLLDIKENGNKIIIDLSSDFQYGGGTDSVYSRMMQLIKTAIANTNNKKIYLYLDGKQVNFLGGEGIMISQPLTEKSLEV